MLELLNINVSYGTFQALNDVSVQVGEGEAIAIVGESGAGKSTLSRIILALEEPRSGNYRYRDQEVLQLSRAELAEWRRQVQAVFQNPTASLDPRMRVRELVTEAVSVRRRLTRRETAELAATLLNRVGLKESLADRFPHELSGGQCQRIAIARAMSIEPELLVLDEPVSGLDVSVRARVLNLLADLIRAGGLTVIYVTHDLATVAHLCHRVYVMYRGRVVEELRADDLHTGADHPYTQLLIESILDVGSSVDLPELVSRGRSAFPQSMVKDGCPFASRCPHAVERCVTELPELVELSNGHRSRCHFAGKEKPDTTLGGPEAVSRLVG